MKFCSSLFISLFMMTMSYGQNFSSEFKKNQVIEVCNAVASWQISNQSKVVHNPLDWTNGALYRGLVAWGYAANNESCIDLVRNVGNKCNWAMCNQYSRPYHADDICVGYAFLELYKHTRKSRMMHATMERGYWIANHPSSAAVSKRDANGATERWSWCDALFMAPPVYASLYNITKEKVYLDYLNREYKACVDSLYDTKEHLFARDINRKDKKEKNGAKEFWGRGNGWVFGGLPMIIDNLDDSLPIRNYYVTLFLQMADKIKDIQYKDGSWRAGLLDPSSFEDPENSGSAFFCYGLAWGINNGFLPSKKYMPTLRKAWESLVKSVHSDGKLGYVQSVALAPGNSSYDSTEVYGVGAFLLAGSEILKLSK